MSLTIPVDEIVSNSSDPLLATHSSWERIPLAEVATILNGFAFPSKLFSKTQGTPLMRIRDVGTNQTVCFYDGPYEEKYVVRSGELVLGMDGDFNCVRWQGPPALLNQRVCKVDLSTKDYDEGFLEYVLPGYLNAINQNTSSVTVRHLSSQSIAEIPLPLPPLAEQKRIVAKVETLLARVNAARQRLAKVPALLKRFRQSILAAACSGRLTEDWRTEQEIESSEGYQPADQELIEVAAIDELPDEWSMPNLESIRDPDRPISYGVLKPGEFVEGGIPLLRIVDILGGTASIDSAHRISDDLSGQYRRTLLQGNEVLVSLVGTIGRIGFVPPSLKGANLHRNLGLVAAGKGILPTYLYRSMNSPMIQRQIEHVTTGANQPLFNLGDLKRLAIPLPQLAEQHEIVRRVEALLAQADRIEKRLATATRRVETLTQAILAQAFRGELVPTEAELARREGRDYEPASALLDRIRATRTTTEASRKPRRARRTVQ